MRDQPVHRVVGEMRIGGVALRAAHGELRVQRAAPADLDHVAERGRVGRLADDAGVERSPRSAASPARFAVPLTAGPSSSPVISRLIAPARLRRGAAR